MLNLVVYHQNIMTQNHILAPEGKTRATVEFPDSVWETAKKFCIDARISFKDLVVTAVREYLQDRVAKKTAA